MEWDVVHLMHNNLSFGKAMWPFSYPIPIRYKSSDWGVFPDASSEPFHTYTSTPSLPLPLSLE